MATAITRSPGDLAGCELTFKDRAPVDERRARLQHEAYRRALADLAFDVVLLPELSGYADAVFVEDVAIVLDRVAVLTRPGAPSRHGEVDAIAEVLAEHRPLERLSAPSVLDGGDVLLAGDVLYVGQSGRTNHAGLKELAHTLLPHGYRIKAVTVAGCLHLKTGCVALDEGTLLANPDWVDTSRFPGFEILAVDPSEPFGANAVVVGKSVLLSSAHPRTAERVAERGFEVHLLELSEFEQVEAGPTCLSLLVG